MDIFANYIWTSFSYKILSCKSSDSLTDRNIVPVLTALPHLGGKNYKMFKQKCLIFLPKSKQTAEWSETDKNKKQPKLCSLFSLHRPFSLHAYGNLAGTTPLKGMYQELSVVQYSNPNLYYCSQHLPCYHLLIWLPKNSLLALNILDTSALLLKSNSCFFLGIPLLAVMINTKLSSGQPYHSLIHKYFI